MERKLSLQFLGGAGEVTGSKHLLSVGDKKILVDCGMFQGLRELRELNWAPFPVEPSSIDVILITHGHADHTGFLPRLVKLGFKGKIIGTAPTLAIAEIIIKDSAKLQEEDAELANKYKYSRHKHAEPLYTLKDVDATIPCFQPAAEGEWIQLFENVKIRFQYNGHILGSTFIEVEAFDKTIVFSGDVGRKNDMLLYPPKKPQKADILLTESTYGDRLHPEEDLASVLHDIITTTFNAGGNVLIPSFAVERIQMLMWLLGQLEKTKKIPRIPIVMDSPMGANILEVFLKYPQWHKLSETGCKDIFGKMEVVSSHEETNKVMADSTPKIIIAGSGMVTGGRILSYMEKYISNPNTTILLTGYQAAGTRGRKLLEGVHELKIYGKYCPVKARIKVIHSLSAHADQGELLDWMSELKNKPEKVFVVHGESQSAEIFREKITDTYGWNAEVPKLNQSFSF